MHIRFLITNAYGGGGTIRTTLTMASALAHRGHEVEVVSVFRDRRNPLFPVDEAVGLRPLVDHTGRRRRRHPIAIAARQLERRPSRLIHKGDGRYGRYNLRSDLALQRYLRSLDDGVLITTRIGLNLAAAQLVDPAVVRIGQEHVNLAHHSDEVRDALAARYPALDAVVTLTGRDADAYRALLGDRTRVVDIPNALPDLGGARATFDPDRKVVAAAGRLARAKGFDLLLKAWRRVVAEHPDWHLRIFGRGPARKRLQRLIKRFDLGAQVSLEGFTTHLHRELAASSFYVLSSRFEGFPMVLLEAMGCGLPVVSFDCPTGPAELITDGVDGLLVEDGSVAALADAINRLIEEPHLRRTMGEAARKASQAYTADAIAQRWETLLSELLARRR